MQDWLIIQMKEATLVHKEYHRQHTFMKESIHSINEPSKHNDDLKASIPEFFVLVQQVSVATQTDAEIVFYKCPRCKDEASKGISNNLSQLYSHNNIFEQPRKVSASFDQPSPQKAENSLTSASMSKSYRQQLESINSQQYRFIDVPKSTSIKKKALPSLKATNLKVGEDMIQLSSNQKESLKHRKLLRQIVTNVKNNFAVDNQQPRSDRRNDSFRITAPLSTSFRVTSRKLSRKSPSPNQLGKTRSENKSYEPQQYSAISRGGVDRAIHFKRPISLKKAASRVCLDTM